MWRPVTLVAVAVAGFVVGSAMAALPFAENNPCIGYATETSQMVTDFRLWPLGTDCRPGPFFGPSVPEALAWVALTTLLFAAAVGAGRWATQARGAAVAASWLAFLGFCWQLFGEAPGLFVFGPVLAAPYLYAIDHLLRRRERRSALRSAIVAAGTVTFVYAVWIVPAFLGLGRPALLLGLAAGAVLAAAAERLGPRPRAAAA